MQEHEKWLAIAKEDLGVAKLSLSAEYFSTIAYHCQQCAEKALKGYLSFKGEPITKTHDLGKALEQCIKFDKNFEKLYESIRELNPFSTKFRYPSEFDIPDLKDAQLAIKQAETVMKFVLKKISEPVSDQMRIR